MVYYVEGNVASLNAFIVWLKIGRNSLEKNFDLSWSNINSINKIKVKFEYKGNKYPIGLKFNTWYF